MEDEAMDNVRFFTTHVNGSSLPLGPASGKSILDKITDDWGAPVTSYNIEAITEDGKLVRISFGNNDSKKARVTVENISSETAGRLFPHYRR